MRRSIITFIALVGISLVNLTITRCSKDYADFRKRCEEAEYLVYVAYLDADYNRILTLTDSLKNLGLFSEGKADYWMGYAYDRLMQKRMAELYWKTGIAAVENSTDDEDVRVYAGIAQRLTGLKCVWGEYEDALKIAQPAVERLEKLGCDTTGEYTNLLIYEGSVTIKAYTENGQLKIAVEDTGIGIPLDQQERVFEQFYKVDSFVPGIGLGLTVARRSAQLLGGTLTLDPTYTTGCRFVLTLDSK